MANPVTRLKRLLVGRPLASERLESERLNKRTALAVLSSDAISSVAYATEQILFVIAVLGAAAVQYVFPISLVIVALLVLVGLSYRQTIFAYPGGGGSYTVAKDNLGVRAGLVAAAALLTDYLLTVAVSIASGVAAITSAYPALKPHTVLLCVLAILLLMVVNLRGVRESGVLFSLPTYAFIAVMLALLGTGLVRLWTGHELAPVLGAPLVDPVSSAQHANAIPIGFALAFLLMRGFAEGCAAMTGTEAISNGITAFRQPAQRNAAATLGWMVTLLAIFFLGVSYLAQHYAIMPSASQTVLSQLGRHVFGGGLPYLFLQYATFAVLVLAANTAFADFPRLASILANERYMPTQLAARGDRLAFSNGIVLLALFAMVLIWAFAGDANALVPLYAVGVFVCFTLSQAGMVVHWWKTRDPGWRWKAALNGLGAVATGLVSIIQVATKFVHGASIIVLIIPSDHHAAPRHPPALRPLRPRSEVHGAEPDHAAAPHGDRPNVQDHQGRGRRVGVRHYDLRQCARGVRGGGQGFHHGTPGGVGGVGYRRAVGRDPLPLPLDPSPARPLRGTAGAQRAGRSGDGGGAGDRAGSLVGASAPQHDGVVHPDCVPLPAERGRDRRAVSLGRRSARAGTDRAQARLGRALLRRDDGDDDRPCPVSTAHPTERRLTPAQSFTLRSRTCSEVSP